MQCRQITNRMIEIRGLFPKVAPEVKLKFVEEFKTLLIELLTAVKAEKNKLLASEIQKKLPALKDELIKMKQNAVMECQISEKKGESPVKKSQIPQKINEPINKVKGEFDDQVSQAIVRQKPNIKWTDVAGLDQAKKVLQEAVILPIKFPEVFVGMRTPWRGILLYGPPGTGKTFLAKACATQMKGGTFFSISSSDLMSKYVGESQKTLKALFSVAKQQKPSIIFIDQIDSIAGERSSDENQVSRRVKTEFLVQMQGVGNDCKDVLVLGATNLPWALDSAVRRRFQKRVYIPLSDIKGRLAMVKTAAAKNNIKLTSQQLSELGALTDGYGICDIYSYSGSDIANVVNDALMTPVRSLDKFRLWRETDDQGKIKYSPVYEGTQMDPNAKYFKGTMQQLNSKGYTMLLETRFEDFLIALKSSKPSVSVNDLQRYIDFTKTFGMDG